MSNDSLITESYIIDTTKEYYNSVLEEYNVTPVHPLTKVRLYKMTSFGRASTKGVITINRSFVGTDCFDKLHDTILHEIAHLVVGIKNKHNRIWRNFAIAIGCNGRRCDHIPTTELEKNVFNYYLCCEFNDGVRMGIKPVQKKSKKRLNAKPNHYNIRGKRIKKFFYIPFDVYSNSFNKAELLNEYR